MALEFSTPFAIPFGMAQLPDSAALNAELRALFLAREAIGTSYANVKPTMKITASLFESRFDLFRWPEPCIRRLREFCWEHLYAMVAQTSKHDPATIRSLVGHADAWFHITRRGGWFGLHNHPMASWSGVYCVDPGIDSGANSGSGSGTGAGGVGGLLSFPHPQGGGMYADMASNALKLPYGHGSREFQLAAGELVLFPSWLMHQVTPYTGAGERITVAFNAWFLMPPTTR